MTTVCKVCTLPVHSTRPEYWYRKAPVPLQIESQSVVRQSNARCHMGKSIPLAAGQYAGTTKSA